MNRGVIALLLIIGALACGIVVYPMVMSSGPSKPVARAPVIRPRKSTIEGDIAVTMRSGSVDHAANVEVLLIARGEESEREWEKEVDKFGREYRAATAAIADSQAAYHKAQAETTAVQNRRMEALVRGDFDTTAYEEANRRANEMAQRYDRLVTERASLIDQHEVSATDLLRKYAITSVRTDDDGHFRIRSVKPGKYWIFAAHRVFDDRYHWLIPIELGGERTKRLDLSNGDAGWPIAAPRGDRSALLETKT